jgi:hypothetical protein
VPEDYHLRQLEQTFQYYRVETVANPTLQFLINIRRKIYDSQHRTMEFTSGFFTNASGLTRANLGLYRSIDII